MPEKNEKQLEPGVCGVDPEDGNLENYGGKNL